MIELTETVIRLPLLAYCQSQHATGYQLVIEDHSPKVGGHHNHHGAFGAMKSENADAKKYLEIRVPQMITMAIRDVPPYGLTVWPSFNSWFAVCFCPFLSA